jgi:hypothetical protein
VVLAAGEVRLEEVLFHGPPDLVEPCGLDGRGRPRGDVGEWRTAPERERLLVSRDRPFRVALALMLAGSIDETLEAHGVDRLGRDAECVALSGRQDALRSEPPTDAGHERLHLLRPCSGNRVTPAGL